MYKLHQEDKKFGWLTGCVLVIVSMSVIGLASAAVGKTTLQVWHTEVGGDTVAAMDEIIAEFVRQHPDVKVDQVPITWSDSWPKLTSALAAGNPPDIGQIQPITIRAIYQQGFLLPVDDVVNFIGQDDIAESVRDISYFDGHWYGLAHEVGARLRIYRKDLYNEAGVGMVHTWDDYLAALEKVTKDTNGDGVIDTYGYGLPGEGRIQITLMFKQALGSNDGAFFDENFDPIFTNSKVIETLDYWKELVKYAPKTWPTQSYMGSYGDLVAGKVATISACGRGVGFIEQYAPDIGDTDHFDVMWQPVGTGGTHPNADLDCEQWVAFADAPNGELGIEFLKTFFEPENYLKYLDSVPIHMLPTIKSLNRDPRFLGHPTRKVWGTWLDRQRELIERGWATPHMWLTPWAKENPYLDQTAGSGVIRDMVTEISVEGIPSMQAAQNAQKRVLKIIEEIKKS